MARGIKKEKGEITVEVGSSKAVAGGAEVEDVQAGRKGGRADWLAVDQGREAAFAAKLARTECQNSRLSFG